MSEGVGSQRDEIRRELFALPFLFKAFLLAAALLVVALAAVALYEIGFGLYLYGAIGGAHADASSLLIAHVLKGVELLFLSPLVYLIVSAVGDYLRQFALRSSEGGQTHRVELALREVERIKKMTASLMIAVIATDLLQRILGPGLPLDAAVFESLVIVVLGLYLLLLERAARP